MHGTPEPAQDDDGGGPDRLDRFREAAYRAEADTGRRETEPEEARRTILVRLGVIVLGTGVSLAGVSMMVLPGPGIVVLLAGLAILAREVAWAERLLAYVRERSQIDRVTSQAPWIKPAAYAVTVIGVVASIVYTVRWR